MRKFIVALLATIVVASVGCTGENPLTPDPTATPQPTAAPQATPPATPAPPAPAPTVQPAPTYPPAPQATPPQRRLDGGDGGNGGAVACLPTTRLTQIMNDASRFPANSSERIGTAQRALDAEFNTNPAIGYRSEIPGDAPGGVSLDNPGPAGKAIFWSNVPSANLLPLVINPAAAGDITKNFIPLPGYWQGDGVHGWGLAQIYTGVTPRTAYTAVRVCKDP